MAGHYRIQQLRGWVRLDPTPSSPPGTKSKHRHQLQHLRCRSTSSSPAHRSYISCSPPAIKVHHHIHFVLTTSRTSSLPPALCPRHQWSKYTIAYMSSSSPAVIECPPPSPPSLFPVGASARLQRLWWLTGDLDRKPGLGARTGGGAEVVGGWGIQCMVVCGMGEGWLVRARVDWVSCIFFV